MIARQRLALTAGLFMATFGAHAQPVVTRSGGFAGPGPVPNWSIDGPTGTGRFSILDPTATVNGTPLGTVQLRSTAAAAQTDLTTEVSRAKSAEGVLQTGLNGAVANTTLGVPNGVALLDANGTLAQQTEAALRSTSRAPGQADDSAHGRATGDLWQQDGRLWRLDDATVGFAGWTNITSSRLPGDVIGLRIASVSTASAAGAAVGDTVMLPNGGSLTVAAIDAASPLTLTGATFDTAGKFNQALSAGTGYATLSASPSATGWAADLWVKTTSTARITALGDGSTFSLGLDATGKAYGYCASGGFIYASAMSGSKAVNDGAWHHLAISSGSTGLSLYEDGVLEGATATPCSAAIGSIGVGYQADNGTNTTPWTGELAEVALWSANRYTASFTPPTAAYAGSETGLITVWHLAGNGNDGRVVKPGWPTAWTVADPHWMACAPSAPVAAVATSGAGTGITVNLTMSYPVLVGTRRLTACYTGPEKQITRVSDGATFDVPFNSDGMAADAAEDQFAQGTPALVTRWYDQGGSSCNATASASTAPVSFPGRRLGNARPVMFNHQGAVQQSESANATTALVFGSCLSVSARANTLAALGSALTVGQNPVGLIELGATDYSGVTAGLWQGKYSSDATFGSYGLVSTGDSIREDGSIMIGSAAASTGTLWKDGRIYTAALATVAQAIAGGTLGMGDSGVSGNVDEDLAIAAPWATTAADETALAQAIETTFAIQPQGQNVIAILGHSLTSGTGSQYQQTWSRVLGNALARPDTHMVDFGKYGDTCAHQLSLWSSLVAPTLATYSGSKTAFLMCGDNDLAAGATPAQIVGYYATFVSNAHTAGAKAVCGLPGYANRGGGSYATVAAFQVAMGGIYTTIKSAGLCDAYYDERANPAFNLAAGPWTGALYSPVDQIHRSTLGQAVEAAMMLPAFTEQVGP